MTRGSTTLASGAALTAAFLLFGSGLAAAQSNNSTGDPDSWRDPTQAAPPPKPHATSDLDATSPAPADEHQSRALAAAVFSRPSAAQRAADKASAANAPPISPSDPKPEWLNDKDRDVHAGGAGVELSRPF